MVQLTNWLNRMVKYATCLLLLVGAKSQAQQITLHEAFQLAEKNYPAIRQKELIQRSEELSLQNLNTGYLPQLSLNGQASYQSDVTKVNISLPGMKVPSQSKVQYKATADLGQVIYDGGVIREQKKLQQQTSLVEEIKVDVELYQLKNRVNQLYFGVLYQDELLKQVSLLLNDIQVGIDKVRPQVENGVSLRSNLQVLQAQALQTQQKAIEIKNTRKGLLQALSVLLNQPLEESSQLATPQPLSLTDTSLSRPELKLYKEQAEVLRGQQRLINAKNLPKASAFVQAGYGRPGLNMLSNEFDMFYISGIRLNWSIGSLYTKKREKQLLEASRQTVELQKETFVLNTQSQLQQQKAEIEKFAELVRSDKAIIELRSSITEAAKAQLENSVITSSDYLREVNAEDAARQSLIIHQIQLLQAEVNYSITAGKF